jgi:hypothetical protein
MSNEISANQAKILLKHGFCVIHEDFEKKIGDIFTVKYPVSTWSRDDYPDMIGGHIYPDLNVRIILIQKPENPYAYKRPDYIVLQLLKEKEK